MWQGVATRNRATTPEILVPQTGALWTCTIRAGWLPAVRDPLPWGLRGAGRRRCVRLRGKGQDGAMGRRRDIRTTSRRSAGPARAFLLTLAVGLLVGLLLGFLLGRIVGGGREQAAPPTPPAR